MKSNRFLAVACPDLLAAAAIGMFAVAAWLSPAACLLIAGALTLRGALGLHRRFHPPEERTYVRT